MGFHFLKYVNEKKRLVQNLIPLPSMYIHMCTLYTYTNTYTNTAEIYSIWNVILRARKQMALSCICPRTRLLDYVLNKVAGLRFEVIKAIIIIEIGR